MKKVTLVIIFIVLLITLGVWLIINKPNDMGIPTKMAQQKELVNKMTLSEVANHSSSSDCWLVIDNKVYNVTDFISNHPGGDKILMGCGKDATSMFNSRPTDGTSHSGRARNILGQYQIGVLTN